MANTASNTASNAASMIPTSGTEPEIFLLWRLSAAEAMALVRQAKPRRLVFVRLVNQATGQAFLAASEQGGHEIVTLPMAFAGLHEQDQVLRQAVLRQLQARQGQAANDAGRSDRLANGSRRTRANSVLS